LIKPKPVPETNRKLLEQLVNKPQIPDRRAYTVREVADMLAVTEKTIYRLLDRQLLKSLKAFRHHRIPAKELERFLRENI